MPKRLLALDFLVAAYGPDKLADPTQAEPVVKRMIELAPNEPANYFQLAKIYEDSGEYQFAEETYLKGRDAKPNDPTVYLTVAGYYNRQGDFPKLVENLRKRIELEPQQSRGVLHVSQPITGTRRRAISGCPTRKKCEFVHRRHRSHRQGASRSSPTTWKPSPIRDCSSALRPWSKKIRRSSRHLLREGPELSDKAERMRKARQSH